ncbi:glycosyltransferase [Nocardioides sp.]|uniref:glycosyltransferase n=1 Tax=Nocardioides sp. TaxID=35761 RepID=UPI002F41A3F9
MLREVRAERNTARRVLARLSRAVTGSDQGISGAYAIDATTLRAQVTAASFVEALMRGEDLAPALVDYAHDLVDLPAYPHRYKLPALLRSLEGFEALKPAVHAALVVHGHYLGHDSFAREHLALCGDDAAALIPVEYARIRIADDHTAAADVLDRIVRSASPTPDQWLDILAVIAAVGDRDTLSRAVDTAAGRVGWDEDGRRALARFADYAGARQIAPAADVVIAVMGYGRPDLRSSSSDLDDYIQTLAALSHVLRRSDARLVGDASLVETATELRARIRSDLMIHGDDTSVGLVEFSRDDSHLDDIPPGTWALAFGRHLDVDALGRPGLPYHPNLLPIFVSFHCERRDLLSEEAIHYLRRYAPIGCRDWYTVDLLTYLDVPAFFSGCVTSTLDAYFEGSPPNNDLPEGFVDARPPEGSDELTHVQDDLRNRSLGDNLRTALATLDAYRTEYGSLTTGRLHCHLAATAMAVPTTFVPALPYDVGFEGLTGPSADLEAMRTRIRDVILEPVLAAVLSGTREDDVYALWRSITEPFVAADVAARASAYELPRTSLDDHDAVIAIRREAWTRQTPQDDDRVIDVCVGLDRNYLTQLYTVLDTCLAGTERPIRLHALVRGFETADYERFASAFPEVDVTFLPCAVVDFGDVPTRAERITESTMDRLLLPDLLDDVDKVLYLDLDLLPFGDIGELYDTELGDAPLAARENDKMNAMGGVVSYLEVARDQLSDSEDAWRMLNLVHRRLGAGDYGFNAGVLVMDLARMRQDDFLRRCAGFIEHFGLNGQYALNVYASGSFLPLSPRWNFWAHRDASEQPPAIVHWIGPFKPWDDVQVGHQLDWRAAVATMLERRGEPDPQ